MTNKETTHTLSIIFTNKNTTLLYWEPEPQKGFPWLVKPSPPTPLQPLPCLLPVLGFLLPTSWLPMVAGPASGTRRAAQTSSCQEPKSLSQQRLSATLSLLKTCVSILQHRCKDAVCKWLYRRCHREFKPGLCIPSGILVPRPPFPINAEEEERVSAVTAFKNHWLLCCKVISC